jgi:hypothetical protein
MSGHTPGSWIAIQADLHCEDEKPDPKRWAVLVDGERRWFVATIENGAPGDTLDTEEANALLIASAPDLLAALRAIVPEGLDEYWMQTPEGVEACRLAGAAIAKSEGR